jgi:hypothetical protein
MLIVFSLCRESLKLILVDEPVPKVVLSHEALQQKKFSKMTALFTLGSDTDSASGGGIDNTPWGNWEHNSPLTRCGFS